MVVAHKATRLNVVNHPVLLLELPVERRGILVVVPPSVKPYRPYRTIVGEKFLQLPVHETVIRVPVLLPLRPAGCPAGASFRIVRSCPVEMRVIEMQADTLLLAFLGEFL